MNILTRLVEPLQLGFLQSAFAGGLMIGAVCGVLGVFVVLRRLAFIGDAVSHTALPGLVVAYLHGWSLLLGAMVAGVVTALGIGWISRRGVLREDTAIGITFTGLFALGIVMISTTKSFRDVTSLLLGNILGITDADLVMIAIVVVAVCAAVALFYKELELSSFDPIHAEVAGLHADRVRYLLLLLLAMTVVVGIQAVGVVLVSGLLVTPAATASLLTNRLGRMMGLAILFAFVSVLSGLYASYFFNLSSGGAIILAATILFAVVWLAHGARGIRA